jgi:hypothetical protein
MEYLVYYTTHHSIIYNRTQYPVFSRNITQLSTTTMEYLIYYPTHHSII